MGKVFKIALLCFSLLLTQWQVQASHMMGGEVSYRCLGGGRFEITFKIYQNCLDGITPVIEEDDPLYYAIYTQSSSPVLVNHGSIESSSTRLVPPEFSNECISNYPTVCLREQIFTTEVYLGSNASRGFTIVYQRCCRNFALNNIVEPGLRGVTYYSYIPPYERGACPNTSPTFKNTPPQIICVNNPFTYDFSAIDSDGDSLVYRLSPSYEGGSFSDSRPMGGSITPPPFTAVPYTFGLSYLNPIPGFPPVSINPSTGILTFTPNRVGRFQVNISVDEYREGAFLNSHSLDYQFVIADCSKNVIANTPLFSDEPNTYIINCADYTVQFRNTSTGGFNYQWDFGDGSPISTGFEPIHTYADTGTYVVTLYVNRGSTCSDSIQRLVKIYPLLNADFTFDEGVCPGDSVRFFETVFQNLESTYTLTWIVNGQDTLYGSNPHYFFEEGTHTVSLQVRTPLGCMEEVTKSLVISPFNPNAGNDTIVVLGYEYNLNASGGSRYQWSPSEYLSNDTIANPSVNFPDTGYYTYVVRITSVTGCVAYDTINILVVKEPSVLMPNAFSPNGDGLNDVFRPKVIGYPFINYLRIYNRWGQEVFVTYNHNIGWNGTFKGKPAETGVYYYIVSVRSLTGEEKIQKGDLTLLR